MFIEDFDVFCQQAQDLYEARPLQTRYCIKYRHVEGKLVLKVTDDKTCLQYKTDQQADLKKLERMNNIFFALCARGKLPDATDIEEPAAGVPIATSQAATKGGKKSRRKG